MDLRSLRSTIDQYRRPSGRVSVDALLRVEILTAYAAWREQKGTQSEFVEKLGLKTSTLMNWLAAAKNASSATSILTHEIDGFRRVKLSPSTKTREGLAFVLPNGARLKGLSFDQALTLLEKFA